MLTCCELIFQLVASGSDILTNNVGSGGISTRSLGQMDMLKPAPT